MSSKATNEERLTPRLAVKELREVAHQFGFNSPEYDAAVSRYSERMRAALIGKRIERSGAHRAGEHYVVEETPVEQGLSSE